MATVYHTLHEQRQESNEEDQENGHNAMFDPIENGDEVVAARLTRNHIALRVDVGALCNADVLGWGLLPTGPRPNG